MLYIIIVLIPLVVTGSTAFQYTLIVSENITADSKLLQLLESRFTPLYYNLSYYIWQNRYNIVLVSREYELLRKKMVHFSFVYKTV